MARKHLILFLLCVLFSAPAAAQAGSLSGRILLQVEDHGEAWYVYPADGRRYFLGRPTDAFRIMKELSLGAKSDLIAATGIFPERLRGRILLDVENNGEAYYINPVDSRKYYLGRPTDAWRIMRDFGLGISNADLSRIPKGRTGDRSPAGNRVLQDVPFTSQAPYGDWSDQRQQDGCEEASALMAVKWGRKESLGKEEALSKITGISDWLLEKHGEYRDIGLPDLVNWIFKEYFGYEKVRRESDITAEDIIFELDSGNIVLAPMNGRLLGNPYFTPPGPEYHMIVIRGYDRTKDVFVTNDPGTRHGQGFEYDREVLYNAIREYHTGYHRTIEDIRKGIVVVSR